MLNNQRTTEKPDSGFFYIAISIIFLAGLCLRLVNLGVLTVSEGEAELSLQSLAWVQGNYPANISGQPGYVLATSILFFLFGPSTFLARLWPSLLGAFVCLTPLLFRNQLGNKASIILMLGLAFDPSLLAVSRQAGGYPVAFLTGIGLAYFLLKRNEKAVGVSAALFLLSGANLWLGLISFVLAIFLANILQVVPTLSQKTDHASSRFNWLTSVVWGGGALVLAGTVLFFIPGGLSGIGNSFAEFWRGWGSVGGTPIGHLLVGLLGYQLLPLIFGIAGGMLSIVNKSKVDLFSALWWLSISVILILYPARQVSDLAWAAFPMWFLSARLLASIVEIPSKNRNVAVIQAVVVSVLILFACLTILGIFSPAADLTVAWVRWAIVAGSVVMVILSALLVRLGWSAEAAASGTLWGVLFTLGLLTLSSGFHAAGLVKGTEIQPWRNGAQAVNLDLMYQTLKDVSKWNTGREDTLDMVVAGIPSNILKWELRDYQNVAFTTVLPAGTTPSILITPVIESPQLPADYRGQDLPFYAYNTWSNLRFMDWISWFFYKQTPGEYTELIIWIRSDLFPTAGSSTEP